MVKTETVSNFYDDFRDRLIKDYIYGNKRVENQLNFFHSLIVRTELSILVVGCGIGDVAFELANAQFQPKRVLGVDISSKNVELADRLFSHDNLEFKVCNIITDNLEGQWDLILFPDVYEHIPLTGRVPLHSRLNTLLEPNGSVALTCPTIQHQNFLKKKGKGLQVIDENVSLEDVDKLASDLGAHVTYYSHAPLPRAPHQYFHAVISRIGEIQQPHSVYPKKRKTLFERLRNRIRSEFRIRTRKVRLKQLNIPH